MPTLTLHGFMYEYKYVSHIYDLHVHKKKKALQNLNKPKRPKGSTNRLILLSQNKPFSQVEHSFNPLKNLCHFL